MTIQIERLKDDVRDAAGNPTAKELPDEVIESHIKQAIRRFSRKLPLKEISFFETKKAQQLYVLNIPAILEIIDVFWHPKGVLDNLRIDQSFFGDSFSLILDTLDIKRPSQYEVLIRYRKHMERVASYQWEFLNGTDLRLSPIPNRDGERIFFWYKTSHTLNTIQEGRYDLLLDMTTAKSLRYIAEKVRKTPNASRGGVVTPTGVRASSLIETARTLEQDTDSQLVRLSLKEMT